MTLKIMKGDLLQWPEAYDLIAHGCNTRGVMGVGFAYQIRLLFPEIYGPYNGHCAIYGDALAGTAQVLKTNSGVYVANMFTQIKPGRHARINYIQGALRETIDFAHKNGIKTIAMPAIGCGYGGLRWDAALPAIQKEMESFKGNTFLYAPLER